MSAFEPHCTASSLLRPGCASLAVREARKLVADLIDGCSRAGCQEAVRRADDVLLVVSELVTNACRHAGGADEVRVRCERGELVVEVEDGSETTPREPVDEAKGETGGYGCQLVTALADRWGVAPRQDEGCGKTVYAGFALN
ncbi:ATP-binding protein [Streptomyces sp. NBC_01264]|uniref:ATP-binding protein n=1 Tax=Streptomyces sp. NBC_01264 TaxID=2903804 RepID=UPI002254BDEE|nr:ATP-binding protein [Streptomyces sp. NBC_01264]MCX4781793.1 ATP-binding protein [Streptomyces sp. NBC_01264]